MFCPVCNSKDTTYFAEKEKYVFYRCSSCKSIFLKKLPSANKLDLFYSEQFLYNPGLSNELLIRKRGKIILQKLSELLPDAKTLCDVGSGYGFFIDEAGKKGYKIVGIEPSRRLTDYAKTRLQVAPYVGELKEYITTTHAQFDIVTCIHVIEHVSNPKEFISLLLQLVKPGGILYLETPNSDSHLLYVEKERYTFLIPPEHLWLLSRYSIKALLPKNALIKHTSTYSYPEHFMGIIKRLIKGKSEKKSSVKSDEKKETPIQSSSLRKHASFLLFDHLLAPLFTGILNLNHKGSFLETYIKRVDN